ncbi:phage/plasmid primase, P4 family [Eubacterium ramulus]|uniref:phage/plasmid primase, P4 family n=1 Tax=Eubacterium ramulus TaxID=39490 RepID=UPI001FA6C9F2|nr:phage/plasmid primase, P4 family [Eubacterium ramulus]
MKADHVCAEYKGNYRGIGNFIRSDVIIMDIDNDHSEEPAEWITAEKLEGIFPDMEYMLASSRHHLLPKEGKSARPRYHIYFPISEITDAEVYGNLKKALQKEYPFFDGNALDAARFIFGADCEEVLVHDGWMTIDEEIDVSQVAEEEDFDSEDSESASGGQILEGSRNNTMSRFAGRVLKRYGITEKAHEAFLEHAKKCDPPLPESELKTIWNSAVKFFKKSIVNQEGYVPPDEYNADFESASLKPEDYSDIGQAKVLVREYGNELKYTSATDFLRFDGECWREDKQMAIGAVEEFLDLQLQDAMDEVARVEKALEDAGVPKESIQAGPKELLKEVDGKLIPLVYMLMGAQTYLKFVQKRRDYKYIVSAANTAKPMIAISVSDLDKNENLINTPYATYDLRKGLAGDLPHNPEDLITKITACSPGEDGKQIWLDALNLFFCKDQKLIDYVQETVGMAAIGKVYQEHMIIAYGGGANGKSTFWNTIFRVLGNYAGKLSAEALTMNCKRNVKPEMAELKGKRLIISSEMEEGMRLNTAVVKQLCSTDEIQAEKKYKDPFSFVPSHTLVLYLEKLKQKRIKIENDTTLEEENVDLPGMASIFTELMLTNKESDELKNIRKILVDWKNSITKSKYRYKVMEWNINQATNKNGTNKLPNLLMKEIIIQNPDILILTEFSFCENASEFFKKVFDERNYDYYPKEKTKNTKNKQNEILIAWRRELFDLCLDKCMYSVVTFENNKPNFLLVDLIEKKTRQELVVAGVRITMAENIPVKGTEDEKKKAYQKQANKRYKQMQYVYKQLEKFARVIMGGDFNNYRRRTELKDWNIGRILCDNQEYKIYTPKGQSIKEKKSIRGEEYEFAEDHFVTKNCEIDNEVYDRCFVFRDEKYINGEDLSDWNYLSGYPDHAILIADLLL